MHLAIARQICIFICLRKRSDWSLMWKTTDKKQQMRSEPLHGGYALTVTSNCKLCVKMLIVIHLNSHISKSISAVSHVTLWKLVFYNEVSLEKPLSTDYLRYKLDICIKCYRKDQIKGLKEKNQWRKGWEDDRKGREVSSDEYRSRGQFGGRCVFFPPYRQARLNQQAL